MSPRLYTITYMYVSMAKIAKNIAIDIADQAYLDRHSEINLSAKVREMIAGWREHELD